MKLLHYVVVGAGVAGLTLAQELTRHGCRVTVVERNDVVGGLGRTWHYGDFHFDLGPHRFHTDSPRVEAYIRTVLASEVVEIRRTSGARMFGRIHPWPLRPAVLLSLPPTVMARCAYDLLRRRPRPGESFESDVLNRYGPTLYELFFRPYTTKFLFHDPSALHRDWARAGVNRAVIDKRASAESLWSLLRTTLLPKPVETTFLYTAHGVGRFSEKLTAAIRGRGGTVLLNRRVSGLDAENGRIVAVVADGERLDCDAVVWTGPITEASRLLGLPPVDLQFLSTIFYNLEVAAPFRLPYQWTYFGGDEVFSRVSAPAAFAPTMAPPGASSLCVEVTCREGDERWAEPGALTGAIVADLVRTRALDRADHVRQIHIERVRNTYPIYKLNYLRELQLALKSLSRFSNLLMAGRCGRFWYNNMDHSIGQALTMADHVLRGARLSQIDEGQREFWMPSGGGEAPITASQAAAKGSVQSK